MRLQLNLFLFAPLLWACGSDNAVVSLEGEGEEPGTEEPGSEQPGTEEPGTAEPVDPYEGATLEIVSPAANSFVPYGEPTDFEAVLWSKDGDPLDFEDINWNSTIDENWRITAGAFEDDELDVGVHTLRVNAELPNGERLFDAVGGVWVQSEVAGTYAGSIIVDADLGEFQVGCAGGAIMVLDVYGEVAEGEADCILSIQGQATELAYVFDLENGKDGLLGEAAVDIYGFQLPTEYEGSVSRDGELEGYWEQSILGFMDLSGELRMNRVSRDTSYYE
ncbi:MAG: hypothetical protein VXW32_01525 [Myxococcota bacterium]|nr:hypothetical protein [Myxococcota bacterium]